VDGVDHLHLGDDCPVCGATDITDTSNEARRHPFLFEVKEKFQTPFFIRWVKHPDGVEERRYIRRGEKDPFAYSLADA